MKPARSGLSVCVTVPRIPALSRSSTSSPLIWITSNVRMCSRRRGVSGLANGFRPALAVGGASAEGASGPRIRREEDERQREAEAGPSAIS